MNLDQVSDADLQAEVKRRNEIAKANRNERRTMWHNTLRNYVNILLALTPNHCRTSCSDRDPCNSTDSPAEHRHGCERCQLLRIQRETWNPGYTAEIVLKFDPLED